jgi:hypothetical protein
MQVEQERLNDLQRQIDELVARVTKNRSDINGLAVRADASLARADAAQRRADVADQRADRMEARSAMDREMLAELQAEELVGREHVAQLETALITSRTIGAALGILMASRHISQEEALAVLKGASQRTNTKMHSLAETIVAGADAIR